MNLNLQKGLKTRSRRGLEVAEIWTGSGRNRYYSEQVFHSQ